MKIPEKWTQSWAKHASSTTWLLLCTLPCCMVTVSLAATTAAQTTAAKPSSAAPAVTTLVDIVLEQQNKDGTIHSVSQGHVFNEGDVVRFRLHSRLNGYLYVTNQSTSGKFSTLFPADQTGSDNRLESGKDYLVPATATGGWFEIEGPAGFETLYFLISPVALSSPPAAAARPSMMPGPVESLKPRCNDALFKARGECVDPSAGPVPVTPTTQLPPELSTQAGSASRDIVFTKKNDSTTVSATGPVTGPVIYTFRLAHK